MKRFRTTARLGSVTLVLAVGMVAQSDPNRPATGDPNATTGTTRYDGRTDDGFNLGWLGLVGLLGLAGLRKGHTHSHTDRTADVRHTGTSRV